MSAVEWFHNELKNLIRESELTDLKPSEFDKRVLELINQAKGMEKAQINISWNEGFNYKNQMRS